MKMKLYYVVTVNDRDDADIEFCAGPFTFDQAYNSDQYQQFTNTSIVEQVIDVQY